MIGPNLKRLEAETLPQFFRHNRFQSFVRQLNFYSFRKINRERTMWVYKHDLFRRDHPEDLPLLRRRTCPTIDGRRQTLPRPLLKKTASSRLSNSKSMEANDQTVGRRSQSTPLVSSKNDNPALHRPSIDWTSSVTMDDPGFHVIPYVLNTVPLIESEDPDDQAIFELSNNSRVVKEDQSMVVLKIASQLAQHARSSCNGSRISGLVTPPFSSSRRCSNFSGTLLTYDDENERMTGLYERESPIKQRSVSNDCLSQMDRQADAFKIHAVLSQSNAEAVVQRLLGTVPSYVRGQLSAAAIVARFCIMTLPTSGLEKNVYTSINEILLSCSQLQAEFQQYKLALCPAALLSCFPTSTSDHDESYEDIVRSFSVFAANKMQLLSRAVNKSLLVDESIDVLTLERAISLWQKFGTM